MMTPDTPAQAPAQDWAPLINRIPFVQHLGARLMRYGLGEAELRLNIRTHHHNSWGAAHGGLVMTLLDSVMGLAARSRDDATLPVPREMVTVQMNTQFMQAAAGEVVAVGRVVYRSFALLFCEATVREAGGRLCAQATGTFKTLIGGHAGIKPETKHGSP